MSQRGPRQNHTLTRTTHAATSTPVAASRPAAAARPSSAGGWLALGCVVLLLFAVGRCSSSGSGSSSEGRQEAVGNAQQALVSAVEAQTPPPVLALSRTAVRRGLSHVVLATREGLAGEMIYSQNCYDALGRRFSWAKLDACGAFDAEAAMALGDDETSGHEAEEAWFQSEAAAGRFLKAAVAAGEPADEADTRWSDLQARVTSRHRTKAPATNPSPGAPVTEPTDGEDVDGAIGNAAV